MPGERRDFLSVLLDLLFPPRCAGCGWRGAWLCGNCRAELPRLQPPTCRYCGRPTAGVATCPDCWRRRPSLEGVQSPYFFEGALRPLIHRFKYRHARYLAAPLSALLSETVANISPVDVVVPVPLHLRRQRERGYNQAALLGAPVAISLGAPLLEDCLERVRDTPPQTKLPAEERRRNVRGAFACRGNVVAGARVLVIDDVCTTGATLDACAAALKKGGAVIVTGLTLARAR